MTRRLRLILFCTVVVAGLAAAAVCLRHLPSISPTIRPPATMAVREREARARFLREHPMRSGTSAEQPLNLAIGKAVVKLHREQPMGRFVLGLGADDKGNDCSDFVNCAIDEGLGFQARFRRHSDRHIIGNSLRYQYLFYWDHATPLLPGDGIMVRHSPWYDPYPGACWHMGIIGADGQVYDFVKLKSWRAARYGRNKLEWFTRHAPGPEDVLVRRLLPEYRYGLNDISGNDER